MNTIEAILLFWNIILTLAVIFLGWYIRTVARSLMRRMKIAVDHIQEHITDAGDELAFKIKQMTFLIGGISILGPYLFSKLTGVKQQVTKPTRR
jgi:hypothetical protein